ncbi:MAG: hypothetical protein ACI32N_00240 [Bulleidia sp.]
MFGFIIMILFVIAMLKMVFMMIGIGMKAVGVIFSLIGSLVVIGFIIAGLGTLLFVIPMLVLVGLGALVIQRAS